MAGEREKETVREEGGETPRLAVPDSMAEGKTSKLQSTATKTVALSSQPASEDFLNYH